MTELKKNLAIKQTVTWACSAATPFNQESILLVCPLFLVTFMIFLASIFDFSGPTRGWKARKVELLAPCGGLQFKFPGFSSCRPRKLKNLTRKFKKVMRNSRQTRKIPFHQRLSHVLSFGFQWRPPEILI